MNEDILKIGTKNGCLTTIDDGSEYIEKKKKSIDKAETIQKIKADKESEENFINNKIREIDLIIKYHQLMNEASSIKSEVYKLRGENNNGLLERIRGFNASVNIIDNENIDNIEELNRLKQGLIDGTALEKYISKAIEKYNYDLEYYNINRKYKCRCSCGNIIELTKEELFSRRRRYCGINCKKRKKYETITNCQGQTENISKTYNRNRTGRYFGTLYIYDYSEDEKEDHGTKYKVRLYKCKCHLCNEEYIFSDDEFIIKDNKPDSNAKCKCYAQSQFQWRVLKVLEQYNAYYVAEYRIDESNEYSLRYDFAIYDNDSRKITHLIECNGEQHYRPVSSFGGIESYNRQKENDMIKELYAKENNITFIEIPYTDDEYTIIKYLQSFNVI